MIDIPDHVVPDEHDNSPDYPTSGTSPLRCWLQSPQSTPQIWPLIGKIWPLIGTCGAQSKHTQCGNHRGIREIFELKSAGNRGLLVEGVGFEPT